MTSPVFYIVWILGAAILGFAISAFFSDYLKLSRSVFLLPYVILTSVFLSVFFLTYGRDWQAVLLKDWQGSLIVGILVSAFLVKNVFSQPSSRKSGGIRFLFDIAWAGLVYGMIDALFLNVMPVYAVRQAIHTGHSTVALAVVGILSLAASLLVTLSYHLGYSEFRNKSVMLVLFGNSLISLVYILTGNPVGAVLSHTAMHVAAVIRGPETTIQLPPHR